VSHPYRDPVLLELPASRLVPSPVRARAVARGVALTFAAFLVGAALAPWQQNVRGSGRVIAYAPLERQQSIEAPIDGRVQRVLVQEGSRVRAGDPLLELSDLDPDRVSRLEQERALSAERVVSYEARRIALEERLTALRGSQDGAVRGADARARVAGDRLAAAEQAVTAAEADLDASVLNLLRHRVLVEEGLVSQREVELAVVAEARARTGRQGARAQRDAARAELEAARASVDQARASRDAEIEGAIAAIRSAERACDPPARRDQPGAAGQSADRRAARRYRASPGSLAGRRAGARG
jgi:adhesin transport system membrane fusion protein